MVTKFGCFLIIAEAVSESVNTSSKAICRASDKRGMVRKNTWLFGLLQPTIAKVLVRHQHGNKLNNLANDGSKQLWRHFRKFDQVSQSFGKLFFIFRRCKRRQELA